MTMLEAGARCICSTKELYNAFGDKCDVLYQGMRLTVKDRRHVAGTLFLEFNETPEQNLYIASAFTPLRNLN